MRRIHLPIGEDGHQIDDPFDDLRDELAVPEVATSDEARREAQIAEAAAILN